MTSGNVYLIPSPIADATSQQVIPAHVKEVLPKVDLFLVENVRTARRYISSLQLGLQIESLRFEVLDKKTSVEAIVDFVQLALLEGKTLGIISESGCPGVADPGANLVEIAHQFGVKVIPLVGPSSILMALMASGFNGQSFAFHGYLPIDKKERTQALRLLEKESLDKNRTQIFMDTPYRNEKLLADILKVCRKDTFLCVAKDISGKAEQIMTKPISKWKVNDIKLHKVPTIFLLYTR